MIFCVFSFNRGQFLLNCIQSIENCASDSKIIVFDDNSDDPETIDILQDIETNHKIVQPGHSSQHHLGGLYGNMQSALEYCKDEELVCYLQDDTQLVHPLTEDSVTIINEAFSRLPRLGFLHPCFIRGINKKRGARYLYDLDSKLYFRTSSKRSAGRFFSALLIMKPDRLLKSGWRFESSEPKNNLQAETLFQPMGYLFSPIAMWLPEVPAYRGKRKTLGLKLAERRRGCGYFPFKQMTVEQIEALNNRPSSEIPYAEDFLECIPENPKKPWRYNPLTGAGWMKTLNQLEISAGRIFKRR
jgi:hypothetical protein